MKKNFIVLLLLLGGVLTACTNNEENSAEEDNSWQNVEEEGQLTVATSGTLYPSSFYNDDNELVGYDVDVAKEVADRLDVDIEFEEYNVDGQISSLQNESTDFAANDFSLNSDREENFLLSSPIKYSFASLIVREEDDSGIASLEDLEGKKAAGEPNTSYMRAAEQYGAELVTYDNATNEQYLTDVANGRTDTVVNDYYLQKMTTEALPDVPVKILDDVYFNLDHNGFLFEKEHEALHEKVNEVLAEMKDDGTLKEISEEYFDADVSEKPDVENIEQVDVE
ncbi:transporter substrate-binding domain-containing protein [Tetragenococcus halophilus]|uniref:transporter substrate-binding domain-containing protein n=1 Tax=Tetragenococcus halophilus TaxID=51669 RepID=UPI000CBC03E5|nr:transporter substrate-binding domain-containing protein [Tetragenococcus halophilus]RQD33177.1 ABC transporter substrate-binding protein [Tetragenococcus halophilus subsp. halophilus DSM 20339]GBD59297.1 putative ABC transporter substrate-binding protein [Tetragenococcus halophilus subsp. halophilus]GBD80872.1 putative ABC transporter substrate-binding protein [Tetragenococcus halophilus subsp. halophilus]GBD83463.1 putative ABC transporter substrate-binding protein [Tetragenococcus halophil